MSQRHYEEVHGVFLECGDQIAKNFQRQVSNRTENLIEETNRFARHMLNALPQDTRELRYRLDDSVPFNVWLGELEDVLTDSGLLPLH